MRFFKIYRKKKMKDSVRTLRIDGVKTTLTPKPDDAELAAQALLESRLNRPTPDPSPKGRGVNRKHADGTPEYYQDLSEKIRIAHEQDRRAAMRYVAYVEAQLKTPLALGEGLGVRLERGLYQHQDTIEREGGELKRRWQKCLATVIVKQMNQNTEDTEDIMDSNEDIETTG
jgi:hypothetical protein